MKDERESRLVHSWGIIAPRRASQTLDMARVHLRHKIFLRIADKISKTLL